MPLPKQSDIDGLTVGEAAKLAYPDITYDTAIPQTFVDTMRKEGFDPVGKCVWVYSDDAPLGFCGALCQEWDDELRTARMRAADAIMARRSK